MDEDLLEALISLHGDGDIEAALALGGTYYEMKKFDLALKYYLIGAMNGLGYMYYYGRIGTPDYEKSYDLLAEAKSLPKTNDDIF